MPDDVGSPEKPIISEFELDMLRMMFPAGASGSDVARMANDSPAHVLNALQSIPMLLAEIDRLRSRVGA